MKLFWLSINALLTRGFDQCRTNCRRSQLFLDLKHSEFSDPGALSDVDHYMLQLSKALSAVVAKPITSAITRPSLSLIPESPSISSKVEQVPVIKSKIVVVGAGIAGLSAAVELTRLGKTDYILLDSSDDVGGRVRSDIVDDFILDRGFQVFITSYPQSRRIFNFAELELMPFLPGAIVRTSADGFSLVSDPFRRPQDIIESATSPIGSLLDKVKVILIA
jgi:hypothetical protein